MLPVAFSVSMIAKGEKFFLRHSDTFRLLAMLLAWLQQRQRLLVYSCWHDHHSILAGRFERQRSMIVDHEYLLILLQKLALF